MNLWLAPALCYEVTPLTMCFSPGAAAAEAPVCDVCAQVRVGEQSPPRQNRQLCWDCRQGREPCAFTGTVNLMLALARSEQRILPCSQ